MYECSKIAVFGTNYKKGQYVILPGSRNAILLLGKIEKLLCCLNFGYVLYRKVRSEYCSNTDLFFVNDTDQLDILAIHQLADP